MSPTRDIETAIIRAVLPHPPAPPADLFEIARMVGVREIQSTYVCDGYTDFSASSPIVYLNDTYPAAHTRFIFAHEIAHIILRTRRARSTLEQLGQLGLLQNEEQFADRIAMAILVPTAWVDALRVATYTLDGLQRVANAAGVSITTLINRLTSAGISIGLLRWFRGDRDWYVVDRPGTPACLHGDLRLADETHAEFDGLSDKEVRTLMRVYNHGRPVESAGTASRAGREVLFLVDSVQYSRGERWYSDAAKQHAHVLQRQPGLQH